MKRRGGYAWGGPATIELLKTKYASPKIDEKSFLELYEPQTLKLIQKSFEITDMWITYSWGFSEKKELAHYDFLRQKLPSFDSLKIRTHLYVQGLNLVTEDFPEFTGWCKDAAKRKLLYSRGRAFICPNHPETIALMEKRVRQAAQENASGVFIDNMIFGYPPPFLRKNYLPFFGCNCQRCQTLFKKKYGNDLRFNTICSKEMLLQYRDFRVESMTRIIQRLSAIAHEYKKEFGINLYDPLLHTAKWNYGYELNEILPYLDYLLIENHSLHPKIGGNQYLKPLREMTKKPIFVVSYNHGIGFDSAFTDQQYQKLSLELEAQKMHPCFKLTEFKTKNIWHAIRFPLDTHDSTSNKKNSFKMSKIRRVSPLELLFLPLLSFAIGRLISSYFTHQKLNRVVNRFGQYSQTLHKPRNFVDPD